MEDTNTATIISQLAEELLYENLAVFVGAGLSVEAGLPLWSTLLEPIATDLGLIQSGVDPLAVAQYHVNTHDGNRSKISALLKGMLEGGNQPTHNHQLLAAMPIDTVWTTNYDELVEMAFKTAGKTVDIKRSIHQLTTHIKGADTTVYKMHGDASAPEKAIITQSDYEFYHIDNYQFLDALKVDLARKTFLFLGFSFTDPNLQYILNRVRLAFHTHQRLHYCIFREVSQQEGELPSVFEQRHRAMHYFVENLKRYGIYPLWVKDYSEIKTLLKQLKQTYELFSKTNHDQPKKSLDATVELVKPSDTSEDAQGDVISMLKTPAPGTILLKPPGDTPPYIEEGATIVKGDILFNMLVDHELIAIRSPQDGVIVEVVANNNTSVQHGRCIFLVQEHTQRQSKHFTLQKASAPGRFYAANQPEDKKLVSVGQWVKKGDIAYIHEIQKSFRHVPIEASGIVRAINVVNAQEIQPNDLLFVIECLDHAPATEVEASIDLSKLSYTVQSSSYDGRVFYTKKYGSSSSIGLSRGQQVQKGDVVAFVRQLNQEKPIISEYSGQFKEYFLHAGESVSVGTPLFSIIPSGVIAASTNSFRVQLAERKGTIKPLVCAGDIVQKDDLLGHIGKFEIRALYTGVLIDVTDKERVTEKDIVCRYGK